LTEIISTGRDRLNNQSQFHDKVNNYQSHTEFDNEGTKLRTNTLAYFHNAKSKVKIMTLVCQ